MEALSPTFIPVLHATALPLAFSVLDYSRAQTLPDHLPQKQTTHFFGAEVVLTCDGLLPHAIAGRVIAPRRLCRLAVPSQNVRSAIRGQGSDRQSLTQRIWTNPTTRPSRWTLAVFGFPLLVRATSGLPLPHVPASCFCSLATALRVARIGSVDHMIDLALHDSTPLNPT